MVSTRDPLSFLDATEEQPTLLRIIPATPITRILAIDPGTAVSGYCLWNPSDSSVLSSGIEPNGFMLDLIRAAPKEGANALAIEWIESYGMAVGKEVFETCKWVGRFMQVWRDPEVVQMVVRKRVKVHLCGSTRATSSNIRQALIDRFGGSTSIGNKKTPGPLYGVKSHAWDALAVAVTACETRP